MCQMCEVVVVTEVSLFLGYRMFILDAFHCFSAATAAPSSWAFFLGGGRGW